jgi:uncharacterized cupin superfamily protein
LITRWRYRLETTAKLIALGLLESGPPRRPRPDECFTEVDACARDGRGRRRAQKTVLNSCVAGATQGRHRTGAHAHHSNQNPCASAQRREPDEPVKITSRIDYAQTLIDDAKNIWDDVPDWGGVGARRLVRPGTGRLGASIWEFQPGAEEYVYHFHHGSDEMLVVLRGTPQVRTKEGNLTLKEGDVLPLSRGPAGGRSISNPNETVARVLIFSSNADPDVAEYPETGKIGVLIGGEGWQFFRVSDAAEHAAHD